MRINGHWRLWKYGRRFPILAPMNSQVVGCFEWAASWPWWGVDGGQYRLCWCAGSYHTCSTIDDFRGNGFQKVLRMSFDVEPEPPSPPPCMTCPCACKFLKYSEMVPEHSQIDPWSIKKVIFRCFVKNDLWWAPELSQMPRSLPPVIMTKIVKNVKCSTPSHPSISIDYPGVIQACPWMI